MFAEQLVLLRNQVDALQRRNARLQQDLGALALLFSKRSAWSVTWVAFVPANAQEQWRVARAEAQESRREARQVCGVTLRSQLAQRSAESTEQHSSLVERQSVGLQVTASYICELVETR